MRIERLILHQFLTFEELDYSFEKKSYLVQGINSTDDEQENNGSGKSSLLAGIEFAIAASNSRGVPDKELITFDHDQGSAGVYISCDIRKETIFINRTIKIKGSGKVQISIQQYGKEEFVEQSFSNVRDGNNFIMGWIGISKEDLFNYYLINAERYKSFFSSSNREKVELINRFSDASIIDGIEEVDITGLEDSAYKAETKVNMAKGKVEQLSSNLERENAVDSEAEFDELVQEKKNEIADIQASIVAEGKEKMELDEDRLDLVGDLKDVTNQIAKAQKAVDEFIRTDWKAERADYDADIAADKVTLRTHKATIADLEEKADKVKHILKHVELQLSGAITCPSCDHEFLLEGNEDVETLKAKKEKTSKLGPVVQVLIEKEEVQGKDIRKGIRDLEELLSAVNKKEQDENVLFNGVSAVLRDIQTKLTRAEKKVSKVEKDIQDCDTSVRDYNSEIKELEAELSVLKPQNNKERVKLIKQDIVEQKEAIGLLEQDLIIINDKIFKRNQWKARFKQFKMFLANKSIKMISYQTNRYLGLMNSDINIKMEGFKQLASGELKEEITATVIRNGRERKFAGFSGGERARLQFSSILANRYMINSTHAHGGMESLFIDEIFESSDQLGLKNIIKTSEDLGITVLIISHVQITDFTENVMTVEKINGISILK